MPIPAKLSTAKTISFGPVLDSTGAEYTGAVVGDVKICKNNGTPAALNGSATLTHKEVGMYELALTVADISEVGDIVVQLSKTTYVAVPVHLWVMPAVVYDSLVAGTDTLPADVVQILGTALTETSAGYLAAAFKKLFDVATPLLVASSPMRGTDGAATAANLATVDTVVDAIKAKTDLLGTGAVTVRSGVSTDGQRLTITRGDAYLIASGTAIRLTLAAGAVRDLTDAVAVRCTVRSKAADAVLIDAAAVTVVAAGTEEQLLDLEFTSAQTAILPVGRASYFDVEADFGDDDYTTVTSGMVLVQRDETRH